MPKNTRKPQNPKGMGNRHLMNAMQGKRSSNAAGFHVPATSYKRKPKHPGKGWSE